MFNVIEQTGKVETVHNGSQVAVQVVEITKPGGGTQHRIELREFVDRADGRYSGPTRKAFAFTDRESVEELIRLLQRAVVVAVGQTDAGETQPIKPRKVSKKKAAIKR